MTKHSSSNPTTNLSSSNSSIKIEPIPPTTLSKSLQENIVTAKSLLPIGKSFDIVTRDLVLGDTNAYFIGVNGLIQSDVLQLIFSDLQNPEYTRNSSIEDIVSFMASKIGFAQVQLCKNWGDITKQILSGPVVLLVEGFDQAIVIDARTYPVRSMEEPDVEHVTKGARDGFVETLLYNTNLIRRRIRSASLVFEICSVGTDSKTDVAIAYVDGLADKKLLKEIRTAISDLKVSSLTMGDKSLEELLVKKHWFHPLPSTHSTGRPDVACSYLTEGHVLIIVDNSPFVLILPSNIFQFTQNPDDYYASPLVGNHFRFIRFICLMISLLLMPVYFLIAGHFPDFAMEFHLLSEPLSKLELFIYILVVEFALDLFKYSSVHSPGRVSGSLSLIGGLIIGDIAIDLNWASTEVLFYAAVTLLANLAITSIEFADGIRIYRLFLIFVIGSGGLLGDWLIQTHRIMHSFGSFIGVMACAFGLLLVLLSVATTPTFGKVSYLWPLIPFNRKALATLLFRYPTFKAQPGRVWRRTKE